MSDELKIDLADLEQKVKNDLGNKIEIRSDNNFPNFDDIQGSGYKWTKLEDVVVVVADLKNSTKLGTGKHDQSTARIYNASTQRGVELLKSFDPRFIDIQGDGFFGIFHGDNKYKRAIVSGMMLAHFSKYILEPKISKFVGPDGPKTGLKIGIASGRVITKPIGVLGSVRPVWAGKPVNYASKLSEAADCHQIITTETIYNKIIGGSDYLKQPCYHSRHPKQDVFDNINYGEAWRVKRIESLPVTCVMRDVPWCQGDENGKETAEEFANAVLNNQTDRSIDFWRRNFS